MEIKCPKCNHSFDPSQAELDEITKEAKKRWQRWYDGLTPEQRNDPELMW